MRTSIIPKLSSQSLNSKQLQYPQIQKYDTTKLFEQFKQHLLKINKQQNTKKKVPLEYKNLLDQIKQRKYQKQKYIQYQKNVVNNILKQNQYEEKKNSQNHHHNTNYNKQNTYSPSTLLHSSTLSRPNLKSTKKFTFNHQNNSSNLNTIKQSKSIKLIQNHNNNKQQNQSIFVKNNNDGKKFIHIRNKSTDRVYSNKNSINMINSNSNSLMNKQSNNSSQKRIQTAGYKRMNNNNISNNSNRINNNDNNQTNPTSQFPQKLFSPSPAHCQQLNKISQQTLMTNFQSSKLQQQISCLKTSLNKLTLQLQSINKSLLLQTLNQQKYKHILYLATSIQNQTDYINKQNYKGYNTMTIKHDDTIGELKKFKTNLRKEKDQLEGQYIQEINQFVQNQYNNRGNKKKQLMLFKNKSNQSNIWGNKSNQSNIWGNKSNITNMIMTMCMNNSICENKKMYNNNNNNNNTKINRKLFQFLDHLLTLLKQKQPQFQPIKQQQCSRIRINKINKQFLTQSRIQIIQKIQQFQQKYDLKLSSIQNLIKTIYKKLKEQNQYLEEQCMKHNRIKQYLDTDLKEIQEKMVNEELERGYCKWGKNNKEQEEKIKKIVKIMKKNSFISVKLLNSMALLLYKFRFAFSLALNLQINKKSFSDSIVQIDSLFSSGLFFTFNLDKHSLNSSQKHDIINQKQFKQILLSKRIPTPIIQQLCTLMFNDQKINLILHKSWLQSRLQQQQLPHSSPLSYTHLLEIISSCRQQCEQIYKSKLPILSSIFLKCYKSIQLSNYEYKLIQKNKEKNCIFLPMGPLKKLYNFVDGNGNNNNNINGNGNNVNNINNNNIILSQQQKKFTQRSQQKGSEYWIDQQYKENQRSTRKNISYNSMSGNNHINNNNYHNNSNNQINSSSSSNNHTHYEFHQQNPKQLALSIFGRNPRKIINQLENIKNKGKKKFKQLNFTCQGKSYKYNQQIIIPNFKLENDKY